MRLRARALSPMWQRSPATVARSLCAAPISRSGSPLRGQLLLAGDEGYDKARRILNPSFDKHPALIAQPTGAEDVQAAVNFARAHNLLVAVKCGGHSHSGQSTCDRGMQIDLSSFRGVRVDPTHVARSVRGRNTAGPGRSRVHGARTGDTARYGVAHGRRRTDAGRRLRPRSRAASAWRSTTSNPWTWSPPTANCGTRAPARIPIFLGRAWRRRQLRRRDEFRIPPAPDATPGRRGTA